MPKWKVYISSTFKDLKDFRLDIITLFEKQLKNNFESCKIMEWMFDEGNYKPFLADCIEAVKHSDIYIIILGNKAGSFPPNENRTYTEIELDTALKDNKYIFCLRLASFNEDAIDNIEKHSAILSKFIGRPTHSFKDQTDLQNCIYQCLFPFASKSPINKTNPYKGLEAFNISDGENFFGRDAELENCQKQIITNNSPCTLISIIGNSGVGKTSFAQAGVLFQLKHNVKLGYSNCTQVIVTPGSEPYLNLKYQLQTSGISIENITDNSYALPNLILYLNQLEEIVTQCHTETSMKEREQFLQTLYKISQKKNSKTKLVIISSFRSDFVSQLASFNFIKDQIFFPLSSLDYRVNSKNWEGSIREVIIKPALNHGVEIDESLVNMLIDGIRDIGGSLPMLQFTLEKIWTNKSIEDGRITITEFNEIAGGKGVAGIIETHASAVVKRITCNGTDKKKEVILKSLFVNLIEVNDNFIDIKKTVKKEDLYKKLKAYPIDDVTEVFEELVSKDGRLLVVSGSKDESVNVDIIHEVLIRKWDQLRLWINERRDALEYKKSINSDIKNYYKGEGKLYRGRKLKRALVWQANNSDLGDEEIHNFLIKSRQRIKKVRLLIFSVFVLFTVVVLFVKSEWYTFHFLLKKEVRNSIKNITNDDERLTAIDSLALIDSSFALKATDNFIHHHINKAKAYAFIAKNIRNKSFADSICKIAIREADGIKDIRDRFDTYKYISNCIRFNDPALAIQIIDKITDGYTQAEAYNSLITILVDTNLPLAFKLTNLIINNDYNSKIGAYGILIKGLRDKKSIDSICKVAIQQIALIKDSINRLEQLKYITECVSIKDYKFALKIADKIPDVTVKGYEYSFIVRNISNQKEADSISNLAIFNLSKLKGEALYNAYNYIGVQLAQTNPIYAFRMAVQLQDISLKDGIYQTIAIGSNVAETSLRLDAASKISSEVLKSVAYCYIASKIGDKNTADTIFNYALKIANDIKNQESKAGVFIFIAVNLSHEKMDSIYDLVLKIIDKVDDDGQRSNVYEDIARYLDTIKPFNSLLALDKIAIDDRRQNITTTIFSAIDKSFYIKDNKTADKLRKQLQSADLKYVESLIIKELLYQKIGDFNSAFEIIMALNTTTIKKSLLYLNLYKNWKLSKE